jgi:predicted RNase H-like HicB family nuclease
MIARALTPAFAAQRLSEILGVESSAEGHPMAREFSVLIERDAEGYYVASVPALRGCQTQATSLDDLMVRVREAVELCLEVQGESVEPLDFIGVQKITVA